MSACHSKLMGMLTATQTLVGREWGGGGRRAIARSGGGGGGG